jgi:hypothetical protein
MDDVKQAANNLLRDLHARNLAIPAGIILVLIVFALVALPKSPSSDSASLTTAPPQATDQGSKRAAVAQLTVDDPASILERRLQTFSSVDPFAPKGAEFKCQVETLFGVPVTTCTIGGVKVITGACDGPSCETGGSGETGPIDIPPPDDDTDGGDDLGDEPYYVVDVTFEGETYKDLESGDGVPDKGTALAFYAGTSESGKTAMFLVADGVSVQGADFDADLGVFSVQEGDSVVLTDETGKVYQFKLKDIAKKS